MFLEELDDLSLGWIETSESHCASGPGTRALTTTARTSREGHLDGDPSTGAPHLAGGASLRPPRLRLLQLPKVADDGEEEFGDLVVQHG